MAIKEVEFIPSPKSDKPSYANMVRMDLEEAYSKRIANFEFEGDYNYKTLAHIVRIELSSFFRKKIKNPAVAEVKDRLLEEGYTDINLPYTPNEENIYFKVKTVTIEGRKHVFVHIDFGGIDDYVNNLVRATKLISRKGV